MSGIATSLLAGAGVGLSIAAPVGPMSLMCIERTLAAGFYVGLATGLGVATVHLTYGMLAIVGSSELAGFFQETALQLFVSALVLLWFAYGVLRRTVAMSATAVGGKSLVNAYCGAMGFGFLNPLTPLLFVAAVPALINLGTASPPLVVAGVFLGSAIWWSCLSTSVFLLRGRLTARTLNFANKAAGAALAGIALHMMAKGYAQFIAPV